MTERHAPNLPDTSDTSCRPARHRPGDLKLETAARLVRMLRRPGIVYCATTTAVDRSESALKRARIAWPLSG